MILTNTEQIPGRDYEILHYVKGSVIQAKNIGRDILSALKSLVGGELTNDSAMLNEARAIATKRMVKEAEELGADAIVNLRFTSSTIRQGAAEILVYGTAVKFREQ